MTARVAQGLGVALIAVVVAACSHPGPAAAVPSAAAESRARSGVAGPPPKLVQLNAPGEPVDIAAALPTGYVTVVDFWAESCEACVTFGRMLEAGVAEEPSVVIRKIDVGDGLTPVARANNIAALPHFLIYDKRKRLRYDLIGGDCEQASTYAKQLAAE